MDTQRKLTVLARVAKTLNGSDIVWALGASALLYFKGIAGGFNDFDINVAMEDIERAERAMSTLGRLVKKTEGGTRPKIFMTFVIDGVEFDIIGGLTIMSGGCEHYFPLNKDDIHDHTEVCGVTIPLQSVEEWREYYLLMGRDSKVKLIDGYAAAHGGGAHDRKDGGTFSKKPEECRYSFFQHRECEFFPCHETDRPEDFNCLFCYCPLYMLGEDCGGNYRYLDNGIKDCSLCLAPHGRGSYSYVTGHYSELAKRAAKGAKTS